MSKIRFFIVFCIAVVFTVGCDVRSADVEEPVDIVPDETPAMDAPRKLVFDVDFDSPRTKSAGETVVYRSTDESGMSVECVAEPMPSMFNPATKMTDIDYDVKGLYLYVYLKNGGKYTYETDTELIYNSSTGKWTTSNYISLPTGTSQVFIVTSDIDIFDPEEDDIRDCLTMGWSDPEYGEVPFMGISYVASYSSSTPLTITVRRLLSAVGFKFSGNGPSGATIKTIQLQNYICEAGYYLNLDGTIGFENAEDDSEVTSDSAAPNHVISRNNSAWLVGGQNYSGYWFMCSPWDYDETYYYPGVMKVTLNYKGTDYILTKSMGDELTFLPGYVYTYSLSFGGFPDNDPYISLDRLSDAVDCNSQTLTVPFLSDITMASTWGIGKEGNWITGGTVTRPSVSGGSGNFTYSVSPNLYAAQRTGKVKCYYDGTSGTPYDMVESAWLTVTQTGTSVRMGPSYSENFPLSGNNVSGSGQTVAAYASSSYTGENINVSSSQSWARANRVGTASYQNQFNLVFDANNSTSSRSVTFTVQGAQSGQSPYNVRRQYTFTQPAGIFYDYDFYVDPGSVTFGVGDSQVLKGYFVTKTYSYADDQNPISTSTQQVNCSWSVNNSSVAYISASSGSVISVSGVAYGSAVVSASYTYNNQVYTDNCTVSVYSEETAYRLQMDNYNISLSVGDRSYIDMHLFQDTYRNGSVSYWDPSGILATPSEYDWYLSSGLGLISAGYIEARQAGTFSVTARAKSSTGYYDHNNSLVESTCTVSVSETTAYCYSLELVCSSWPHSSVVGHIYPGEYVDLSVQMYRTLGTKVWNGSSFVWSYAGSTKQYVGTVPASQCQWRVNGAVYSSNSYISINTGSGRVTGTAWSRNNAQNVSVRYNGSAYVNQTGMGDIVSNSIGITVDRAAGGHD